MSSPSSLADPWGHPATTAFPRLRSWLAQLVSGAELDVASLQTRMHRCALQECGGVCCANGAYLEQDEAEIIPKVVAAHSDAFAALGFDSASLKHVAVRAEQGRTRTGTRVMVGCHGEAATACVFQLDDARCALQVVATDAGLHPWAFKPLVCWLHPLDIHVTSDRTVVGLFRGVPPPFGSPPSVGSAPCSQREPSGVRAADLLVREMAFLSGLTGWTPVEVR